MMIVYSKQEYFTSFIYCEAFHTKNEMIDLITDKVFA